MSEEVALGLDFGCSYCSLAVLRHGKVTLIPTLDGGSFQTPTYVTITPTAVTVGQPSKSQGHSNLSTTIFDIKRLLGRRIFDNSIQNDLKLWPFRVLHEKFLIKIQIGDQRFSLEQILAHIFTHLKNVAENFLKQKVSKVVIAVPSYFYVHQIDAIRHAGNIAGLKVIKIIQEPIAVALAYNHQLPSSTKSHETSERECVCVGEADGDESEDEEEPKKYLIIDLGGGTFEITIVTMVGGLAEIDTSDEYGKIGGEGLDHSMVDHCLETFRLETQLDLVAIGRSDENVERRIEAIRAFRRLKFECEEAKIKLFGDGIRDPEEKVQIEIKPLFEGKNFRIVFDEQLFNKLNEHKFEKCIEIVEKVVENSELSLSEISDIVLVGGSSRIPRIREMLSAYFGGGKKISIGVDPYTAVAVGAAIEGARTLKRMKEDTVGIHVDEYQKEEDKWEKFKRNSVPDLGYLRTGGNGKEGMQSVSPRTAKKLFAANQAPRVHFDLVGLGSKEGEEKSSK